MKRDIRIIGVKRREVDEEKLALAFLLLAKHLYDQGKVENLDGQPDESVDEAA